MKKIFAIAALAALLMPSCQMVVSPLSGWLYTNVNAPGDISSNAVGSLTGTAMAETWLGAWAEGDASINAAANSRPSKAKSPRHSTRRQDVLFTRAAP